MGGGRGKSLVGIIGFSMRQFFQEHPEKAADFKEADSS